MGLSSEFDPPGNKTPVNFSVYISTFVKALTAFIIANVIDLVLEEFFVQWYYRKADVEGAD